MLHRDNDVPYETEGRYQDAEGAKNVDKEVLKFLADENISYKPVYGIGEDTLNIIINDVKEILNGKEKE